MRITLFATTTPHKPGMQRICYAGLRKPLMPNVRHPWQRDRHPVLMVMKRIALLEGPLCQLRHAGARCAGVVRRPVVRSAGCGQRARVLDVIQIKARCEERNPCWVWFRSRLVVPT